MGLFFYAWLMVCLFRLARSPALEYEGERDFLGRGFRKIWPLLLIVYFLNASAVVMNYQFVNGSCSTGWNFSAQNYRALRNLQQHAA